MKKIIFPNENGISILTPVDSKLTIDQIAIKDVPVGLPYLIVDESDIPMDRTFRNAWEADFSEPHGIGGQGPIIKQEIIEAEFQKIEESEVVTEESQILISEEG